MDFTFSQEQDAVRELARKIMSTRANDDSLRGFTGEGDWLDRALWNDLAEAQLLGLALPQECGGGGFGLLDLCILLEEQGRCLAPLPLLATTLLAALPIAEHGSDQQRAALLPGIVGGDVIATAALYESGAVDPAQPRTEARRDGSDWLLNGVKECVSVAHLADLALVPARAETGVGVFLVDMTASGITCERQNTVNYEPQARLTLNDAHIAGDAVLGTLQQGVSIVRRLEQRACIGLAALQVGICEEALQRTAAYTSQRHQFGRPIGSFQGVSLRAADAYIAVEAMRSTMWQAAWRADAGLPIAEAAAVAKWWAARGGHEVVHTAQHLHGGIGADVDYPIHRFFLWAKQIGTTLGGESAQLLRLGDAIAARGKAGWADGEVV